MTEIPEHLLRRSRERREALGLAGGEGAGSPAEGGAAPATQGEGAAPAAPAAAATPATPAPAEPAPEPEYAPPAPPRKVPVPAWAMPVLALLPFWAILYAGAFGERPAKVDPNDPAVIGARVYRSAGCSGCHGPGGEGGVGPALDQTKQTFPSEADMISWVKTGSGPFTGQMYFNSGRVATGGMPAFGDSLSEDEIKAVVTYVRDRLGG